MNRHVARICRVLPFQYELASVSKSYSLSSGVGYLDRLEIVEKQRVSFPDTIYTGCFSISLENKPN